MRTEEPLVGLERRKDGTFLARTPKGEYRARRVVLATGQRGNPRRLGVPGEELEHVYHRLYSPTKYRDEEILVVGGGNSAVEAALTLAERNRVRLSYRGGEFSRLFKDNRRQLDEAVADGRIELILNSNVREFRGREAVLEVDQGGHQEERVVPAEHAFVLIGAELPVKFLKSLGIRLENEWTGSSVAGGGAHRGDPAGAVAARRPAGRRDAAGARPGGRRAARRRAGRRGGRRRPDLGRHPGQPLVLAGPLVPRLVLDLRHQGRRRAPSSGPTAAGATARCRFSARPWSFWYTVLYTTLMTVFGIGAIKRWGIDRKDKFQIWRYTSLLGFQWVFFFILPEFLFQWAVKYQWVGEALATDPQFADQAWRSYGIVYAWPLFFYTWLLRPAPDLGGLGRHPDLRHHPAVRALPRQALLLVDLRLRRAGRDLRRPLAPPGAQGPAVDQARGDGPRRPRLRRPRHPGDAASRTPTAWSRPPTGSFYVYRILVDVWLVGILPVTVYPFMGGKVWCRYWCPLAKMMQVASKAFTRLGWSRFHIVANDKCIACNECSRNCQVGIDVMSYALKQETLDNATSSCIGCGICVTVCPMDTLSFDKPDQADQRLTERTIHCVAR